MSGAGVAGTTTPRTGPVPTRPDPTRPACGLIRRPCHNVAGRLSPSGRTMSVDLCESVSGIVSG